MGTLRVCETCGRTFESTQTVCPDDQTPLLTPDDELIGQTVDRYVLVKRLGKGAMGTIYLGVHPMIRSHVAVKVLHESREDGHNSFSRFVLEARAVNEIKHPNIVRIMDLDALPDGRPFIIMEYLEGLNLRERMIRGPLLEPAEANQIVTQILSALAAAHEAGFVHRDLKPDNIFITNDGEVRLLDFGIAKLLDDSAKTFMTQDGSIVGTPMYLSPEQALGEHDNVGPWTDLYSMGVILYEMYTGKSPFDAKGVSQILLAHIHEPPVPPSERGAVISAELERTILWCLAKSPADRPQSASALSGAYELASGEYAEGLAMTLPEGTLPKLATSRAGAIGSGQAAVRSPGRGAGQSSIPGYDAATHRAAGMSDQSYVQGSVEAPRSGLRKRTLATLGGIATVGVVGALLLWSYAGGDHTMDLREVLKVSKAPKRRVAPRGRLVVMQRSRANHLSPLRVTTGEGINILRQTHEPLMRYENLGGRFHPCLATKMRHDGKTYYFRIRHGVRFHDNTLLTPQRVVASLKRSLSSKLGKSYLADVKDVKVGPSKEVVIDLTRPSSTFLHRLSLYPAYISGDAPKKIGRHGTKAPLGTGPYKVVDWNQEVGAVTLGPHPGYWGKPPRLKEIVFRAEPNAKTRANLLKQGRAHIASFLPSLRVKNLEKRREMDRFRSSSNYVSYLVFNTKKKYLQSAKVRQALSLAVDRDRLVRELYGGSADKADRGSVPPSLIPNLTQAPALEYNPKRARKLLATEPAARRKLTLYVYSNARPYLPQPKRAAQILKEGFAAAGIQVEVRRVPLTAAKKAYAANQHDLAFFGWGLDYPDAENIYYLLSNKGTSSGYNFARFDDPEYNRLFAEAEGTLKVARRQKLFRQMEQIIEQKRPWLPLAYIASIRVWRTEIKGMVFQSAGTNDIDLTKAYLSRRRR
jgi:eukaryotic-like serine/threonine-protein kinase